MDPRDREILQQFKALVGEKLKVERLTLFGSRARGDACQDSDMDVLVVVDSASPDAERYVSECAWEAGIGEGVVVTPITYSAQEWASGVAQRSLLAAVIREEGIEV